MSKREIPLNANVSFYVVKQLKKGEKKVLHHGRLMLYNQDKSKAFVVEKDVFGHVIGRYELDPSELMYAPSTTE